jgi:nucleotide-binding universal stress UspA family protein
MTDFTQHILVATDLSPASLLAVDAAATLAKTFGARVTLAHVFDPSPLTPTATSQLTTAEQLEVAQNYERHLQGELEQLRDARLAGVDAAVALLRGRSAADDLCRHAEQAGVDLIVIATHGRTGLARMLIGSVTERVVRHASCPVLTLRSKLD